MTDSGISRACVIPSGDAFRCLSNIHYYPLCEIPHRHDCLKTHVFLLSFHTKRASAYQTWVFLYPALQFSIDVGRVTLKRQEKHRSTKESSILFLHQKASLGPGRFHSQTRWWLEPDWNRVGAKYQIAFGGKLSGLVTTCHPSYHLPFSRFLSVSLFNQQLKKVIAESLKQPVSFLIYLDIHYLSTFTLKWNTFYQLLPLDWAWPSCSTGGVCLCFVIQTIM